MLIIFLCFLILYIERIELLAILLFMCLSNVHIIIYFYMYFLHQGKKPSQGWKLMPLKGHFHEIFHKVCFCQSILSWSLMRRAFPMWRPMRLDTDVLIFFCVVSHNTD
jgi:hypothetical protein